MIDIPITIAPIETSAPAVKKANELDITISESAATHIAAMADERDDNHILRLQISGGGCSGFQTSFDFVEFDMDSKDYLIQEGNAAVVIDPMSATLIDGATIDYISSLMGSYITLTNPNTVSCGCGNSFRPK